MLPKLAFPRTVRLVRKLETAVSRNRFATLTRWRHGIGIQMIIGLLCWTASAQAQDVGTVRGVTTTQSGSVFLPGVAITITPDQGGQAIVGSSDESGRFAFPDVPAGQYRLSA